MRYFYFLGCFVAIITPLLSRFGFSFTKILTFYDEFLTVLSCIYIVSHFNKLYVYERKIILFFSIFLFAGACGTINNKFQTRLTPLALNVLGWTKFISVFIYSNHLGEKLSFLSKRKIISKMNFFFQVLIVVAFIFGIANLFFNIGMSNGHRMGIRCYSFIYDKAQTLSNSFYTIFFFLLLGLRNSRTKKQQLVAKCIIIMALMTWAFTLRSRAFVFIMLFSFLFMWMIVLKKKFKTNVVTLALIALCSLFVASEKLEDTFENDAHPRAILLGYGVKTMREYFPFGGGLGTYGTDVACKYYSQLYYKYGFNKLWKLNPWDYTYAHDTYWPAVMGECGMIGLICMFCALLYVGKEIFRKYENHPVNKMLFLFLIISQIMASIPTSVFFQSRTVYLAFLLPLAQISNDEKKNIRMG